jgi:hypothetical protein
VESFADQLPALVGVVVGALGAFWVATFTDRTRWRREQATKWDAKRLDAYGRYALAIKEIHSLALRIIAQNHPRISAQPIDETTGLKMLAKADMNRTRVWESMLLLGDESTIAAARGWMNAVRKVELLARSRDGLEEKWSNQVLTAVREVNEARDRFYVAARQGLAVGGETEAQAPWLLAGLQAPDQAMVIEHKAPDPAQPEITGEMPSAT